ncbi:hypothetical protein QJS10_CPA09g01936 [Acorus calamus]|uniref:Folate-biopterin transporter 8, chloroplastic n=1 Tax=Acorus calamus TaxID=4465 RepID=A0AAV9E5D2_ACOCL|nr:hypothetical protein QJS10_CPA09g01936 [Acorus calamus]
MLSLLRGNTPITTIIIPPHRRNPSLHIHSSSTSNPNQKNPQKQKLVLTHIVNPIQNPKKRPPLPPRRTGSTKKIGNHGISVGNMKVLGLCGFGYWVQGFRCFPWLALNFYMAHGLRLDPSSLQLVQHSANLPMVAKPLYGVLSDALYFGGAHRIPYISFGVFIQIMSWGTLALLPVSGGTIPIQMACILLSNLGASFTEVASDALVAELSKNQKAGLLQSYSLMALAAGGILGNFSGGFFLLKTQQPRLMFSLFCILLSFQLLLSLTTKEDTLYKSRQGVGRRVVKTSVSESLKKQFSELVSTLNKESISHPLSWAVASVAFVPLLSGAMFCYQTQCLKLDPLIIGLSKVIGQLMVLSATVLYNKFLNRIPLRKLICGIQITYALSLLLDLILVKQLNLALGISNEVYVLCLSSLAEAVAQFKILPFFVLLSKLCLPGCEGSLLAFFSSALCLSSIVSGVLGIVLSYVIGVSSGDYSSLPAGILFQVVTALMPLGWISRVPSSRASEEKKKGW